MASSRGSLIGGVILVGLVLVVVVSGGPSDHDAPLDLPSADRTTDPEDRALQAELSREIQHALAQRPEDQRIALIMVDIQGLSYEEIATTLNTNLGTVQSRISRARFKMRDLLLDRGELLQGRARSITERET